MNKRIVVIDRGVGEAAETVVDLLRGKGWSPETIQLSKGEPLPKSLDDIFGLVILGGNMNVYEQQAYPLNVYLDM
jgi:GMP synthase-like glutamine amidotransferase